MVCGRDEHARNYSLHIKRKRYEFVVRPGAENWLENAEWHYLDEY
jgi:hypothetical protein